MPFIPVPNVAKVVIQCNQQGQICQNVFHVYGSAGWDDTSLNGLISDFEGWLDVWLTPRQSTEVEWTYAKATDLTTSTSASVERTFSTPYNGSHAGTSLPMNSTIAVGWRTGLPGRSFRGRTYHIGLIVSDRTDSTLLSSPATALVTAYGQLMTILSGGYGVLVVASLYTGNAARLVGLATPITEIVLNLTMDSQRRRLPERGR